MENRSDKINEIRLLIAEIEILDAINRTIELAESLNLPSFRDEALLLKVNQVQIRNDKQKNIDEASDLEVRQNRVIDQTLNLLTRLEGRANTIVENRMVPPVHQKENIEKTISKTIERPTKNTPKSKNSDEGNNRILIAIIVTVTLIIVVFLLYRMFDNKNTSGKEQNLPLVTKVAPCDDYVKRIEAAIAAKSFEKAKDALIAADEVCDNKLKLQFLLEDYNTALLEASQTDDNSVETEPKPDDNPKPEQPSEPGTTIKPGLVQVNPGILNIKPELLIRPELLNLDYWTGTWKSSFGNLAFVQIGTEVFGDYGNAKGWLQGKYDSKTKLFSGTFYNAISKKQGNFQFKKNGNSFEGKWGWKSQTLSQKWSGTLIGKEEPILKYYKNGFIGRVLDEKGKPIARAKVTVNDKSSVFTNTQGLFQIPLPTGSYRISASHANYQTERLQKTYRLKEEQEKVYFKLKMK